MPYLSKKEILGLIEGNEKIKERVEEKYNILEVQCPVCGIFFVRKNKNGKYCDACKNVTYDRKICGQKKNRRNEYKKMYARKVRGKITQKEFDDWKQNN